MAILDIARGQQVAIPAIHLTNGKVFAGVVRASDGESLMIDVQERTGGSLPSQLDDMAVMTWEAEGVQRSCPILIRGNSPRSLVAQVVIQERRESPRLRIDMQLTYEIVPPAKVKETAEAVMARLNTTIEPASEAMNLLRREEDKLDQLQREVSQLRDMLTEVLSRIDALTMLVTSGPDAAFDQRQPLQIMNISSTGVGFIGPEVLRSGDYLHLNMVIHSSPRTVIDCMGVVVRCTAIEQDQKTDKPEPQRYDVGVRFTHIHEADRERLIHYLFRIQRRMLRDLKEKRLALADQTS